MTVSADGTITSAMGQFEWTKGGWTRATCTRQHTAPSPKCTCGIYSVETWEQLHAMGYHFLDVSTGNPADPRFVWVIAYLLLGGRIITSSNGVIRAARATPKKVYVPGQYWRPHEADPESLWLRDRCHRQIQRRKDAMKPGKENPAIITEPLQDPFIGKEPVPATEPEKGNATGRRTREGASVSCRASRCSSAYLAPILRFKAASR